VISDQASIPLTSICIYLALALISCSRNLPLELVWAGKALRHLHPFKRFSFHFTVRETARTWIVARQYCKISTLICSTSSNLHYPVIQGRTTIHFLEKQHACMQCVSSWINIRQLLGFEMKKCMSSWAHINHIPNNLMLWTFRCWTPSEYLNYIYCHANLHFSAWISLDFSYNAVEHIYLSERTEEHIQSDIYYVVSDMHTTGTELERGD
jgi:hypothetical protein